MLETLHIQNYALIEDLEIEFQAGLNALTGETGAGKSIVVGALNLVLGARAAGDVLRAGADRAKIEALFRVGTPSPALRQRLEELDIELEDGALLLARVIAADGRSKAYAGGALVPIAALAAIGDELVDLHGQHEHQSLLKPERQLGLVDGFAGTETAVAGVADQVSKLRALERQLHALEADDRDRTRQLDYLRHEVEEIDAAGLTPGEDVDLKSRINLITHQETIHTLASEAYATLYEKEEGAAVDSLDAALRDLHALAVIDPRFAAFSDQLREARVTVEAVASELRAYCDLVEYDPDELNSLHQRLAQIGALKRKFGGSVEAVLAHAAAARAELDTWENRDAHLEELRRERGVLLEAAQRAAQDLSRKRVAAAQKLHKQVSATLQGLGMKGARFEVVFTVAPLSSTGIDHAEFTLAANTGEKPKPLRQVASGGEISRIMLALKAVFAGADRIPTLIFDEIDAGVGGGVANAVAEKLQALAASHQVICITHLSQIAAVAGAHFHVSKRTAKNRTVTEVMHVQDEARVQEVARLLDGTLSAVSLEHARALLARG